MLDRRKWREPAEKLRVAPRCSRAAGDVSRARRANLESMNKQSCSPKWSCSCKTGPTEKIHHNSKTRLQVLFSRLLSSRGHFGGYASLAWLPELFSREHAE